MEKLKRIYWLKKELLTIQDELNEIAIISAPSFENSGGVHRPTSIVENVTLRTEALRDKLRERQDELADEIIDCEDEIGRIKDDRARLFCRLYFISGLSYAQIGEREHYDRTTIMRAIKKAIEE